MITDAIIRTYKKVLVTLMLLRDKWRFRGMFIIADGRDNSVTFSRRLFNHLHVFDHEEAKVFVFHLANSVQGAVYAFMLNPDLQQETQLAEIQFNQKHKCIGFECLVPTVNRILYDYGMNPEKSVRLKVLPCYEPHQKKYYYVILRP